MALYEIQPDKLSPVPTTTFVAEAEGKARNAVAEFLSVESIDEAERVDEVRAAIASAC